MKLASIERILEVNPHPNADALEFVKVLGYSCIVGKGDFKVGDKVILIQPDTVLPDRPWSELFKKRSSRVKAIKLRGEWSFGIVMSFRSIESGCENYSEYVDLRHLSELEVGTEVSNMIGVTKYEAPVPQQLDAKGSLPFGIYKTDEERFQNIDNLPYGSVVDLTLKIDGCLEGNTRVLTSAGEITIAELVNNNMVGTMVATVDVDTNEIEFQPILSTSEKDNEGKQWYEVELSDGTVVILTENHKVWLPDLCCYRRADELVEGDVVLNVT